MAKEPKPVAPDVYIVGLARAPLKPGPSRPPEYTVVTGTVANPVFDTVAQPLGNAAEAAKIAWLKLLESIP